MREKMSGSSSESEVDDIDEDDEERLSSLSESSDEDEDEDVGDSSVVRPDKGFKQAKYRLGRKKGQSYRSSYDSSTLKAAYHAVVEDGMAVYAASRKYSVPQSTLRDRVLGRVSADVTTSGPPTIFSAEEEAGIASYVKLFAEIGYPLNRNQVRQVAGDLAAQLERRGFTDGKVLSLRWYYKIVDRFPDMQTQKFANSKLQEIGYGYYKKLAGIFEELGLEGSPKRVFLLDVTSIQTETSSLKMICRNLSDDNIDVSLSCNNNGMVSLIGCSSANGKKIPPCFVLPTNNESPSRKSLSKIHQGVGVKFSSAGDVTPQILRDYFECHFPKYAKVTTRAKKLVVFYNSAYVSIPLTVWLWGQRNNIQFFPLPLHKLLDRELPTIFLDTVAELYEAEHKAWLDKNPGVPFRTLDSLKILSSLYSSLQPSLFEKRFSSLGIFPLPAVLPGMVKFDKLLEDMKTETKSKLKRPRKKTSPSFETSPPKRKKTTVKPKPKLVKPTNWRQFRPQNDHVTLPRTLSSQEDDQTNSGHQDPVPVDLYQVYRPQSIENGVTLKPVQEDCESAAGVETYQVFIQDGDCVAEGAENVPVVVAEEVIIMETEDVQ